MANPSKAHRILAKVNKLVKTTWGKILILFTSFPALRYIYNLIDAWGNLKTVTDGLPTIWSYINTAAGSMVVSLVGIGLIGFQLHRQDRRAIEKDKDAEPAELEPAAPDQLEGQHPAKLPFPSEADLTFEIDTDASQVRVGDGAKEVQRIYADVKLRCFKKPERVMAVRALHISLHRSWPLGDESTVVPQEDEVAIWEGSKVKIGHKKDVWTIREPTSDRTYQFILEITPKIRASLSDEYFLRISMDVVGQELQSQTVYVEDWHVENNGFSPISLTPREELPLAAQKEINRLKEKLTSYEKTNEALGRFNENFKWLTGLAGDQAADIDEYVSLKEFTFCYMTLTPDISSVVFGLYVTNKSVLDIRLDTKLDGVIKFEGADLLEPKRVISTMDDAPHGATRSLTIEQRLSPGEANRIESHRYAEHANFEFDDLILHIVGGKRSPNIKSKRFKIPKNTRVHAFPLSPLDRAKRIRTLSEVQGSCIQLHEPLRISSREPLDNVILEAWRERTIAALAGAYTETGAKQIFMEMSYNNPIPSEATAQGAWLRGCIVVLGDLIARETGESMRLIKSKTNDS